MATLYIQPSPMAAHLVIIPSPGSVHILAALELAKLLVERERRLSVSILLITFPNNTNTRSISSHDRITYVHLSPEGYTADSTKPGPMNLPNLLDYLKPQIKDFLAESTRPESTRLAGVVIDMFCAPIFDLVDQIDVPSYTFSHVGAGFLCIAFHALDRDLRQFKDSETELAIPGFVNSVPAKVLPVEFTGGGVWSETFLSWVAKCKGSKGILVNTFLEFQSNAITYLSEQDTIPPIYPVGPLLNLEQEATDDIHATKRDAIISWLDNQPVASVVFICFGSMGTFDAEQVTEIAHALEKSGTRFLWSLSQPIRKGYSLTLGEWEDFADVLPKDFMEKTAKTGKVISWAPETAVLSHSAIRGFVSHCGWNSSLESIWFGVPLITWPLAAEHQSNAFELVRETGIAVELKLDYKKDGNAEANYLITAEEIEKAIKQLSKVMDSDDNLIKQKVKDMSEKIKMAIAKGGSSYAYIDRFIEAVMG